MKLDKLQAVAEAAEMMPWDKVITDVPYEHRAALKDAVDAKIILALIAVAKAAKEADAALLNVLPPGPFSALRAALAALEAK